VCNFRVHGSSFEVKRETVTLRFCESTFDRTYGNQPQDSSETCEATTGTLIGNHLVTAGEVTTTITRYGQAPKVTHGDKIAYDLTFSPATGHFSGTKNGKAVWAAKLVVQPLASKCVPIP
jgi:hypothetical protein